MTDTPTGKKLSERLSEKCQAWYLANELLDGTAAARRKSTGELMLRYIDAILSALRLSESHPSAIREAVEGEREACAALVAAHGIEGMPFDVGSWTPGAVAAAIRARGEEKGNG